MNKLNDGQKRLFLVGTIAYMVLCLPVVPIWFSCIWVVVGISFGPFSLTPAPPDDPRAFPYLTWLMMLAAWPYAKVLDRKGLL